MSPSRFATLVGALACWGGATSASANDLGLTVPQGFEVSLFADDALAHDIFSMTIDSHGRVVVAGAGYVKILEDTDGDGRADRAKLFSSLPASGAHGMFFDGNDLICTGDNSIMRLIDEDGDGDADFPPQVWTNLRHPEHGANGIVRGPDGCYYVACGNDAGVSDAHAVDANSPVDHPHSGAIVRLSRDGKPLDVFAHGFRNPYDLDFDASSRLLTVDSDGERDHHLPWYAPTRLFDVAQGMEHGWLLSGWARGWNRPASFFDSVDRAAEFGRGSPTGLVVYRHRAFPARYQGGVFAACWTFGRVYYCPLEPQGSTVRSKFEIFMQTTGETGFAPCDLAVGPDGDLFVAIGGRRTRGSVFRVHYTPHSARPLGKGAEDAPLEQVLDADQPLASWSRARWLPIALKLGRNAFAAAAYDPSLPITSRLRAIEVLTDTFRGLDFDEIPKDLDRESADIRAKTAWALGRSTISTFSTHALFRLTSDSEPVVQRAAWEALVTAYSPSTSSDAHPDWARALGGEDRRVRSAAIAVAQRQGQADYLKFLKSHSVSNPATALALIRVQLAVERRDQPDLSPQQLLACLGCLSNRELDPALRLEAIRLLQIALGDLRVAPGQAEVFSGYTLALDHLPPVKDLKAIALALAESFPAQHAEVDREMARLAGMLRMAAPAFTQRLAEKISDSSRLEDDLHYLIVSSLLKAPRSSSVTSATADALLQLHKKLDRERLLASRNWPLRVGELFDQLCREDANLPKALLASQHFGHGGHVLFAQHLFGENQLAAIRRLWLMVSSRNEPPSAELVSLTDRLPRQEALELVRPQWSEAELRDAVVLVLARDPQAEDRPKFVEALSSPQSAVVAKAARALVELGMNCSSDEMVDALRALKRACAAARDTEPRTSLLALLNFWTEENSDVDLDPDPAKVYVPWFQLFDDYYPAHARRLKQSAGSDAAGWRKRLGTVNWDTGDPAHGRALYERQACHRCHQVEGHLGPELKGAIARLTRDDLFTAIIDPNLEVSPTYQTTVIATDSGQVYHGLVVYESPEGTLLQTGPDTTVRITDVEKSSMRPSTQSLMPSGLLDTFSDQDLADLYAHLKSLAAH
ncbi:MAG TPA: c-type cytochrome [Pirellulales bacterium]|nr:c-type cytochrome [Pirellulales bacterium]